jgi:hypothetical protein
MRAIRSGYRPFLEATALLLRPNGVEPSRELGLDRPTNTHTMTRHRTYHRASLRWTDEGCVTRHASVRSMVPRATAVLTSGGDAAGTNAAIGAVMRAALDRGWRTFGVERGIPLADVAIGARPADPAQLELARILAR